MINKRVLIWGAMALAGLNAEAVSLYEDAKGQVFTSPAEGRMLIHEKEAPLFAHADKIKLSGLTYIGYTYNDFNSGATSSGDGFRETTSQFEIRRAYLQAKAYFLEDKKSYYRVTLDVHQDNDFDTEDATDGDMLLRIKYAYLYLDGVLPYTGVEIGIAHRPWNDYEEHNSWYFRNISEVLVEQGNGANLTNSADFGVNFKTKTDYFDSEIGLFNGEGYHATQIQKGMSFEWRTTAHLLGTKGEDKQDSVTYWDASFYGQYNQEHRALFKDGSEVAYDDLVFGGVHTVFNMPAFLIAAQYIESLDTRADRLQSGNTPNYLLSSISLQAGSGYGVNAEYRMGEHKQFRALARYDLWKREFNDKEQRSFIGGFAWDQNENLEWVASVDATDNEAGSAREEYNGIAYMLTAQVEF